MSEYLPPVVSQLTGEIDDFLAKIAEAQAVLEDFASQSYTANLGLTIADVLANAQIAQDTIDAISGTDVPIMANDADLLAKAVESKTILDALQDDPIVVPLDVDPTDALEQAAAVDAYADRIEAAFQWAATLDISEVETKLAILNAEIAGTKAALNMTATANLLTSTSGAGAGSGGGGGNFWGTLLGSALGGSGGNRSSLASFLGMSTFGGGLLPTVPVAGFGTLGSLAGLGPESLLGLIAGIGGSALNAGLGGLALGATSLGVMGTGMGTDMAGIGQALGDIKNVTAAQNNLNAAIAEYGPASTEAATAQAQLNYALNSFNPIAQQAVLNASNTIQQFKTMFDQFTGEAEAKGAGIIQSLVETGEAFLPTIGAFASKNMTIIMNALGPLETWLKGPGLEAFTVLEQTFTDHLPTAMHAFDQAVELVLRTMAHFAPETGHVLTWLNDLFTRLNGPGFDKFMGEIQNAIDSFHTWMRFIKSVGDAIYELFHHDAGTGKAVIEMFTKLIDEFVKWAKTVAGGDKLHEYMEAHKKEVLELIELFGHLIGTFGELHLSVGPALMTIIGYVLDLANAILKIPGVGWIASYGIALYAMSKHIPLLSTGFKLLGSFIQALAEKGLVMLGSAISNLGGPFSSLGGWLQKLGTTGPTVQEQMQLAAEANQAAADSMQEAAATMQEAAAAIVAAYGGIAEAAADTAADVGAANTAMATDMTAVGAAGDVAAGGEDAVAASAVGMDAAMDANPIGLIVIAIEALAVGLYELVKHFDAVSHFLNGPWGTAISAAVVSVAPLIGIPMLIIGHWRGVVSFFKGLWSDIKSIFHEGIDPLKSAVDNWAHAWIAIWNSVKSETLGIWHGIEDFFKGIKDLLQGNFSGAASWLEDAGKSILNGLWNGVKDLFSPFIGWFKDLEKLVKDVFKDAAQWLIDAGKDIIKGLEDGVKSVAHTAVDAVKDVGHDIVSGFKDVLSIFSPSKVMYDQGVAIGQGVTGGIQASGRQAVAVAKQLASEIIAAFGSLTNATSTASAVGSLKSIFTGLSQAFDALAKAAALAPNVGANAKILAAGLSSLAGEATPIKAAIDKLNDAFGKLASSPALKSISSMFGTLEGLFKNIGTAAKSAGAITQAGITQLVGALQTLQQKAPAIQAAILNIQSGFAKLDTNKKFASDMTNLSNVFSKLSSVFKDFGALASSTAGVSIPAIGGIWAALTNLVKAAPTIAGQILTIQNAFQKLDSNKSFGPDMTALGKVFSDLAGIFKDFGTLATDSAALSVPAIGGIWAALQNLVSAAPSIVTEIEQITGQFNTLGNTKSLNNQLSQLGTLFSTLDTIFQNVASASSAAGSVTPAALQQIATAFQQLGTTISQFSTTITTSTPNDVAAIQSLANQMLSYLNNTAAIQMGAAGTNLMTGLANGIHAGAGAAISAAQSVANQVTAAVKSATQTASPSRVFHNIGLDLMAGLANGIRAGFSSAVRDALNDVTSGLQRAISPLAIGGLAGHLAISPLSASWGGSGGGSFLPMNVTVVSQIDGRTVAQTTQKYMARMARSQGTVLGQYAGSSQTAAATSFNTNAIQR